MRHVWKASNIGLNFQKWVNGEQRKNWTGENIEIDKNTVEGGEIIEETTEPVAETIEPVTENEEGEITEETTESVAETIEPVAENEEGEIKEETTESVAETIEPVAENYFLVTVAPDLTIREGRNRHPSVWLTYYNFGEGIFEEDEENIAFLMISDPANFEEAVKSPKWRLAREEEIKSIEKKSNMEFGGSYGWSKENKS